mmetsp:Transcript_35176/g.82272  ORF Transcript_35176/g.82272 Transcript_35176/m.82272 type:complete len:200 (-) Transcript_35176:648-1247(-)
MAAGSRSTPRDESEGSSSTWEKVVMYSKASELELAAGSVPFQPRRCGTRRGAASKATSKRGARALTSSPMIVSVCHSGRSCHGRTSSPSTCTASLAALLSSTRRTPWRSSLGASTSCASSGGDGCTNPTSPAERVASVDEAASDPVLGMAAADRCGSTTQPPAHLALISSRRDGDARAHPAPPRGQRATPRAAGADEPS